MPYERDLDSGFDYWTFETMKSYSEE